MFTLYPGLRARMTKSIHSMKSVTVEPLSHTGPALSGSGGLVVEFNAVNAVYNVVSELQGSTGRSG